MAAVLNSTVITPKVMKTMAGGNKTSEVFTLNTEIQTASASGWATPAADGTAFQVVSDGWSRLAVWTVHEVGGTSDASAKYSVIGQRPFVSSQIKTAATGDADAGFDADDFWLPCPVKGDVSVEMISAARPVSTGGVISNGADVNTGTFPAIAQIGIATGGTNVYALPSVVVDCSGTLKISAYVHTGAGVEGGVILGQFIA
tara:strand:- start:6373 stop:6975 length:603 start_codon:yes stop_codon:yes gene_type:complete